jgi:hypothetical protein
LFEDSTRQVLLELIKVGYIRCGGGGDERIGRFVSEAPYDNDSSQTDHYSNYREKGFALSSHCDSLAKCGVSSVSIHHLKKWLTDSAIHSRKKAIRMGG